AKAAHITVQTKGIEPDAQNQLVVDGDRVRIEQIVWNLLSNAIKFTEPEGTVTVSLTQENTEARIDVKDTGIGIEGEFLKDVFEMFKQVGDQRSGKPTGMGIGLA